MFETKILLIDDILRPTNVLILLESSKYCVRMLIIKKGFNTLTKLLESLRYLGMKQHVYQ